MSIPEEDYLWLSGIQNFAFCRRQWSLMRIENLWSDNRLTAEGTVLHEVAHDSSFKESRGNKFIVRGLRIVSHELCLSGECDVIEFRKCADGIEIQGKTGLYIPYPIEYKRGEPKDGDEDRLQVCAEAMCLEEMLCCSIPFGYLFYHEIRRREQVIFTDELRNKVKEYSKEMLSYQSRKYTPIVKPNKKCNSCSIKDLCMAKLSKTQNVRTYIKKHVAGVEI